MDVLFRLVLIITNEEFLSNILEVNFLFTFFTFSCLEMMNRMFRFTRRNFYSREYYKLIKVD